MDSDTFQNGDWPGDKHCCACNMTSTRRTAFAHSVDESTRAFVSYRTIRVEELKYQDKPVLSAARATCLPCNKMSIFSR
eukprot:425287-Amphidinium_carterae.3